MPRLHVHLSVDDLDHSVRFYSALFHAAPVKQKADYAKWMLEDPKVNFAISARGAEAGIDHLGLQAEDASEMTTLRERIADAEIQTFDEGEAVCCYAKSDKTWVRDPNGIPWETYHTMADAEFFGDAPSGDDSSCCAPETPVPAAEKGGCCPSPDPQGGGCC